VFAYWPVQSEAAAFRNFILVLRAMASSWAHEGEREIPGGLEAAADAGGDGKAAGLSFILPTRELPYERRPPGISSARGA
jgi:hypothetical protein